MTLEPGIHDPSEAPWWEFYCEEFPLPVVKQWMAEAADVFAARLSLRNAGGDVTVETVSMSLDGMSGHYIVRFQQPVDPVDLYVRRGDQTVEPKDELPNDQ